MPGAVVVNGLDEIQKRLAESGPAVDKAMKTGLREAADPVAKIAEIYSLDPERISGMHRGNPKSRPAWAVTRIGITRHFVYIVPKQRGIKGHFDDPRHRPNLVKVMLDKSFEPALAAGEPIVRERVTTLLGEVTRAF